MKNERTLRAARALLDKTGDTSDSIELVIRLAVAIASADGTIDDAEQGELAGLLAELLGGAMAPRVLRLVVADTAGSVEREGPSSFMATTGRALADAGAGSEGVELGVAMASSSEGIGESERALLVVLAQAAGVSLPSA
jgi:hypothetical protein